MGRKLVEATKARCTRRARNEETFRFFFALLLLLAALFAEAFDVLDEVFFAEVVFFLLSGVVVVPALESD